jgi:predicted heme/steroid binding protein
MRKINFLLVSLLVVASGFFASCEKDDEGGSSIDFFGGNYIDADATVEAGSTLAFKFTATSETSMELLEVEMTGYGVVFDEEIPNASNKSYTKEVTLTAPANAGTYTYEFQIWDNADGDANLIVSKSITITVTAAGGALTTYTDKILGAQTSSNGSSFLSVDGTVLQIADAKANSNKVDFMYYYSGGDLSTIVAPSDASAATQFNNATNGVATWSVKNATKLKKLTGVTFESITNASAIEDVSSTGSTKVTSLAVGDVVAFKTASTSAKASKKGVFKVTAISAATTAGSITIQVKVE